MLSRYMCDLGMVPVPLRGAGLTSPDFDRAGKFTVRNKDGGHC